MPPLSLTQHHCTMMAWLCCVVCGVCSVPPLPILLLLVLVSFHPLV